MEKKRVVFTLVEAGLGHIMPLTAVYETFQRKYGDEFEAVSTSFFNETNDDRMKNVEQELIKEVKLHNKFRFRGKIQFALLRLFGQKNAMKILMEKRYKKGLTPSIDYIKNLHADLIFCTHFAPLYYSCKAKNDGLINSKIVVYCPDPVVGMQWDRRADIVALSSYVGKEKAIKQGFENVEVVPFLIREKVKNYIEDKQYYRKQLGIPENNFTIFLADGFYGAGKLRKTVLKLLKSKLEFTIIAVCGKNQKLYEEFSKIKAKDNIFFAPYGFTDKTLELSACCDLFIGKAGASSLAEPAYFGAPQIVTFCATPVETWICKHYTHYFKCAKKITNINKAVRLAENFILHPQAMQQLKDNCVLAQRSDGPEQLADIIYNTLK